jgi:hypothetical protein
MIKDNLSLKPLYVCGGKKLTEMWNNVKDVLLIFLDNFFFKWTKNIKLHKI